MYGTHQSLAAVHTILSKNYELCELREVHTDEGVLLARHQAVDGAGLVQVPPALLHQTRVVRGLVQSVREISRI